MMVPGQVTMIPVFILFKNLGIIDTYAALILPAAFSAYGTFMLRQYFLSIPAALEEAAVIDGATKLQILIQIIVPLSKTALSTLAIFAFIYAWNDFMWPLIVINSDQKKTLPIMLQSFQTSYGAQWHLIMAASMIVLIPVITIFIFGQKYITRGIMMTGIK
jgi:multiple sugar transport system permease protein